MKIFFLFLLLFKYFVCKVDIKEKFKQFLEEFVNNFYFSFEDLSVFNYTRYQITTMKTKYYKMTHNNLTVINDTYASLYNNTIIAKADFFIKLKGLKSFNHLNVFYKFTLNPLNFVLEDFYQKFSFDSVIIDEVKISKAYDFMVSKYFEEFQNDTGNLFNLIISSRIKNYTTLYLKKYNLIHLEFKDVMDNSCKFYNQNEFNFTYNNITLKKFSNFSYELMDDGSYNVYKRTLKYKSILLFFNVIFEKEGKEESIEGIRFHFYDDEESIIFSKNNFILYETYGITPAEIDIDLTDCLFNSFIKYFNEQREIYYE